MVVVVAGGGGGWWGGGGAVVDDLSGNWRWWCSGVGVKQWWASQCVEQFQGVRGRAGELWFAGFFFTRASEKFATVQKIGGRGPTWPRLFS